MTVKRDEMVNSEFESQRPAQNFSTVIVGGKVKQIKMKVTLRFKCGHMGTASLRPEIAQAIQRGALAKNCADCLLRKSSTSISTTKVQGH